MVAARRPTTRVHDRTGEGIRSAFCIALLAVSSACERGPERPSSALLITLDTTRADALSTNGAPFEVTPFLDDLASEGVVYELARAVAPITLPSHVSILTGLYPPRHGTRDNGWSPLSDSAVTLAERASEAGLETAAFVAAVVLDPAYGLDQGFALYRGLDRRLGGTNAEVGSLPGREVAARAGDWLRALEPSSGFFLWVHLFDPHEPLAPQRELLERAGGNPYLAEVAAADAAVGDLLGALREIDAWDTTVVAVVGDHGEGLGEHGEKSHGVFCYDSTLRIPYILRYPETLRRPDGRDAGRRSREIVSVVDVFPTLIDALALGDPGDVDGVSLFGAPVPANRGVYFESYYGYLQFGWAPLVGWVDASGKYLHGAVAEFYDLAADPSERSQRRAPSEEFSEYREAIRTVLNAGSLPVAGDVSANTARQLEQLGYAAAGDGPRPAASLPNPLTGSGLADPRERREDAAAFDVALSAANQGDLETAIRVLSEILARNPNSPSALHYKAAALASNDRCAEALPLLEQLEALRPRAGALSNQGTCLLRLGRAADALRYFDRALALDPGMGSAQQGQESARAALAAETDAR